MLILRNGLLFACLEEYLVSAVVAEGFHGRREGQKAILRRRYLHAEV